MPTTLTQVEFLRFFFHSPCALGDPFWSTIDRGLLSLSLSRSRAALFARLILRSRERNFRPVRSDGSRREFSREKRVRETFSRIHFCRQAARDHPYPSCLFPPLPSCFPSTFCADWHRAFPLQLQQDIYGRSRCRRAITTSDSAVRPWWPAARSNARIKRPRNREEREREREREREKMMRIHSGWVYVWALTSEFGRVNEGARGGIGGYSRRRSAKRGTKVPGVCISARNVEYKAEVILSSDFNPPRLAAIFHQRNCSFAERFPCFTCHVGIFTSTTVSC